jgi:DNA-binding transcriptional MocR family regulator
MNLVTDPHSGVPMTDQLVTGIATLIRTRTLLAGVKLPSIRSLAAEQRISRFPVIEAYDRLSSLGLIVPKHGSGFYVAHHVSDASGRGGSDPRLAEEESNQILQQFNYPGETLKLSSGFVPEAWRDIDGISQTVRQLMRTDPASLIDYAMPHGDANLRQQIQMRLAIVGVEADLPNIMVTSGASQALDLVVRFMLKPGDTVFVEDPGYYNLFGLLKLQGVRIVGVPRIANGPDLDVAEHLLKDIKPKLFFVNTVFHNPTATNIAPPVAFRLLQLAQQHDFTIVEDDIYADYQATPTQRLARPVRPCHLCRRLVEDAVVVAAHRLSGRETRPDQASRRREGADEPRRFALQRMRGGRPARARNLPQVSGAAAAPGAGHAVERHPASRRTRLGGLR